MMRKIISIFILVTFITTSTQGPSYAQNVETPLMASLPAPGMMVHLSPVFMPAHLLGLTIHPDNALQFDFLINRGDQELSTDKKKEEYKKLVKYFLASLTIPDQDQWVNLSPYEKDRIIKDDFSAKQKWAVIEGHSLNPKSKNFNHQLQIILNDYKPYLEVKFKKGQVIFVSLDQEYVADINNNGDIIDKLQAALENLGITVIRQEKAMKVGKNAVAIPPFGGIDFNSANMNLQIRRGWPWCAAAACPARHGSTKPHPGL